jgi:hypothetical protein
MGVRVLRRLGIGGKGGYAWADDLADLKPAL